jgi:hypothetical protein
VRAELEFAKCTSAVLMGHEASTIREGFLGAIAVLRLRRRALTTKNIRIVLRLNPKVVESYLAENPDIRALLLR